MLFTNDQMFISVKDLKNYSIADIRDLISNEVKDESKEKLSKKESREMMQKVENEMRKAAKELDFERAMQLRDILFEMKANEK